MSMADQSLKIRHSIAVCDSVSIGENCGSIDINVL